MHAFSRRLAEGPLLCDGAMGTMLYARGGAIDACFDVLNLNNPALVQSVHADYVKAGADCLETNTFGANRFMLAAHGFAFEEAAENGDLVFLGQLNDRPAIVIALFGERGLTKVMVSLPTEEGSTMDVYREMRKVLGGEYGSPALEVERYAYPFANGHHVGYEMAALRTGKATIGAKWQTNGENLGIKITEGLIVAAHYESPGWAIDAERRRQ